MVEVKNSGEMQIVAIEIVEFVEPEEEWSRMVWVSALIPMERLLD